MKGNGTRRITSVIPLPWCWSRRRVGWKDASCTPSCSSPDSFAPSHRLPQDNSIQRLVLTLQRPPSPTVHLAGNLDAVRIQPFKTELSGFPSSYKCPTLAAEGTVMTSLTPRFPLFYTPSSFLSVYKCTRGRDPPRLGWRSRSHTYVSPWTPWIDLWVCLFAMWWVFPTDGK